MKKTVIFILAFTMFLSCAIPVFASESKISSEVEYYEDGSYAVTTLEIFDTNRATNTKSGKKTKTVYDNNGSVDFSVTITATFTYTGTSSTCTTASATKNIVDTSWSVTTSTTKSGNVGRTSYTGKQYMSGVLVNTLSDTVTLTCSNTGVLS